MQLSIIEQWFHLRIQGAMTNGDEARVIELSRDYFDFLLFLERFDCAETQNEILSD
jgi:hypothetical protein